VGELKKKQPLGEIRKVKKEHNKRRMGGKRRARRGKKAGAVAPNRRAGRLGLA